MELLAQTPHQLGGTIGGTGLGPFSGLTNQVEAAQSLAIIVSSIVGAITVAAFIWFFINILVAGLRWLQSEGDKNKLEEAQSRLTNAFVGLIIVVASYGILSLVTQFFGVPNILNPAGIINQLRFSPTGPIPTGPPLPRQE